MSAQKSSRAELTEEESAEQLAASIQMRKDFTEAIKSFLDDIPKKDMDSIGILLSGGVDSTTLLWVMMELGLRPKVYTYTTSSTKGMSMDHKKAQALAEHYNLPLNVVHMSSDPEYVTQTIEKVLVENLEWLRKGRIDKEVAFLVHEMGLAASKDGIKYLFSGLGEGNIHMLGRKTEIRGHEGRISNLESAISGVGFDMTQVIGFAADLSRMGVRLCAPHFISNARGAFSRLSWRQVNRPRKKEATLRAYSKEMEFSGINPQVSPMQSGDSGARDYFEEMVTGSEYARRISGRPVTSSIVYYNALERLHRPSGKDLTTAGNTQAEMKEKWAFAALVNNNVPLPEDTVEGLSLFIDLTTGKAKHPNDIYSIVEVDEDGNPILDDGNLFGDLIEDVPTEEEEEVIDLVEEDDGSYTDKVDCFGYPLYIASSQRGCPYAQAGLCGSYKPCNEELKDDLTLCSSYRTSLEITASRFDDMAQYYGGKDDAYTRAGNWCDKESDRLNDLAAEKAQELKEKTS